MMLKWSRIFQSKCQGWQHIQSPYISIDIPWSGRTFSCGGSIKFPLGDDVLMPVILPTFSTILGNGIRCVPSGLIAHLGNRIKQALAKGLETSHLYQGVPHYLNFRNGFLSYLKLFTQTRTSTLNYPFLNLITWKRCVFRFPFSLPVFN